MHKQITKKTAFILAGLLIGTSYVLSENNVKDITAFGAKANDGKDDTQDMHPEPICFPKRELLGNNKERFYHPIPPHLEGSIAGVIQKMKGREKICVINQRP